VYIDSDSDERFRWRLKKKKDNTDTTTKQERERKEARELQQAAKERFPAQLFLKASINFGRTH